MLKVKQFCFNPFAENTYLIYDADTRDGVVVDPGMWNSKERDQFDKYVTDNSVVIKQIINTHLHVDHCFGANYVRDRYGVNVSANIGETPLGEMVAEQGRRFGIHSGLDTVTIDVHLKEGDVIKVGDSELHVIEVPGHSPGGIALYCPQAKFVITGDSLFHGAIGRTDLMGGDMHALVNNIKEKLLKLPDDTAVLPGHEDFSTIGDEKKFNPYLK